jgi:hypothetical protein
MQVDFFPHGAVDAPRHWVGTAVVLGGGYLLLTHTESTVYRWAPDEKRVLERMEASRVETRPDLD